jgi:hypothetical protein
MWLPGFFLAHTLTSPCFGCEPKARVVTLVVATKTQQMLLSKALQQNVQQQQVSNISISQCNYNFI